MSQKATSLLDQFNHGYKNFTPQEQTIIDSTEGIIEVRTTPITETADIFALRIAKLLLQGNRLPGILSLVKDDATCISLQAKLEQLIGGDVYTANIFTVDGFCEDVLKNPASGFENKSLLQLSAIENIQVLKTLIDHFPKNHPLKHYRSDVYQEMIGLKNLFSDIKREGWSVEKFKQKIDKFLDEVHERMASINIDHPATAQEDIEMIEKVRAAVNEFDHYQQVLQINKRFDKDDLLRIAVQAFEENKNLLSSYQQKFQYIQVEGNYIIGKPVERLLQLLMANCELPNLVLMNSEEENAADPALGAAYSKGSFGSNNLINWKKILLTHSSANKAEDELLNRLFISVYHSPGEEMAGITKQVDELLQKNIDPTKIGIICPDDRYIEKLEQYFITSKIPFYGLRKVNLLSSPFIKKILQLMRYISAEQEIPFSGDDLLFEILQFDFYKVPPTDIAALTIEVNSKKYGSNPTTIRKLLKEKSNAPAKDLFDAGINKNLKELSAVLEKLIADAAIISLQQLYENMISQALVQNYAEQSTDNEWLMQLFTKLNDFIKSETTRNPKLLLSELIEAFDILEKEGFPLVINRINRHEKFVQIVKPAAAKNHDFSYIFIAGSNAPLSEKNVWYNYIHKIAGTVAPAFSGYNQEIILETSLRPAAAVIAPQLSISFSKFNNQGKELAPAFFVTKFLSDHTLPVTDIVLTEAELNQYALFNKTLRPEIMKPELALIKPIVQKFVMNVSALNSYLNCPLGFYYKNIIRIPASKNEAFDFGSAVHYALEMLFKKMSGSYPSPSSINERSGFNNEFPPATVMLEDFTRYMKDHRANFTREAFERRIQYGEEVLRNYYDQYINSWNKVVSVERNMRGITVNGVPLKGKLDKLEFSGKDVNIVDYKTGDVEKALLKMTLPAEHDPNGGDYWRQAVFYKILVDNYEQKGWKVKTVEFDFIEPDKNKLFRKEKIWISDADIETVKQQFTRVWNKIQAHDFYTGCGKQNCHWCNFVKNNGLAVTIQQPVGSQHIQPIL